MLGAFGFDAGEAEFFAKLFEFHDADELLGGNGNSAIAISSVANYADVMGATTGKHRAMSDNLRAALSR